MGIEVKPRACLLHPIALIVAAAPLVIAAELPYLESHDAVQRRTRRRAPPSH